jgi:hypothetical protein
MLFLEWRDIVFINWIGIPQEVEQKEKQTNFFTAVEICSPIDLPTS